MFTIDVFQPNGYNFLISYYTNLDSSSWSDSARKQFILTCAITDQDMTSLKFSKARGSSVDSFDKTAAFLRLYTI